MPPVRGALVSSFALARKGTRAIACSSVRSMVAWLRLAGGHLGAFDDAIGEGDNCAAQGAFTVLAAGIDAGGAADLDHALRLMDVSVQAEHWLVLFDGL